MGRRDTPDKPFAVERLVETEHRAGIDLAWIVVVAVALCVLAIAFTVPDQVLARIRDIERFNANGILALLVVVPFGATAFALRRYRDAVGAQKQLMRLSLHDALTDLPNRRHIREVLPATLVHASRNNTQAAVMFLDLDGFKGVNDTYGHEVGDQLMRAVATRLVRVSGADRWVARYAGDEFVVLDPSPQTHELARRFADELVRAVEVPFEVGEDRITISASVGVAFGDVTCDPEELLREADVAMYAAKRTGEHSAAYSDAMRDHLTPATAERRLEEALDHGEFTLVYQPIVALRSGRVVGAEALLRWDDPRRGLVAPADFLMALEDSGLIVPVGRWVMAEACRQAANWASLVPEGRPPLRVTMNASPRQLAQADFVDDLRSAITTAGLPPSLVYLELTEAALTSDPRATWASLEQVHALGVGLALDDFGTGYSALNHLRSFELELLKLDRTFLDALGRGTKDDAVVRHVIALARDMGIATLAEGISDPAQVRALIDAGCELGQGYHYAEPQPATIIEHLVRTDATSAATAATAEPAAARPDVVLPTLRRGSPPAH